MAHRRVEQLEHVVEDADCVGVVRWRLEQHGKVLPGIAAEKREVRAGNPVEGFLRRNGQDQSAFRVRRHVEIDETAGAGDFGAVGADGAPAIVVRGNRIGVTRAEHGVEQVAPAGERRLMAALGGMPIGDDLARAEAERDRGDRMAVGVQPD